MLLPSLPEGVQSTMTTSAQKSNPVLTGLIHELRTKSREGSVSLWKDIAWRLSRPSKTRVTVNVTDIAKVANGKETILIPGKLLGTGEITKPVKVAALTVSKQAREKVERAGGSVMSIRELIAANPEGSNVRIVG
jgi:large subunit ribosomal protein L18e